MPSTLYFSVNLGWTNSFHISLQTSSLDPWLFILLTAARGIFKNLYQTLSFFYLKSFPQRFPIAVKGKIYVPYHGLPNPASSVPAYFYTSSSAIPLYYASATFFFLCPMNTPSLFSCQGLSTHWSQPKPGFLILNIIDISGWIIHCWDWHVHCRIFCNIPCPVGASSIPPVVTTNLISRHYHISPREQKHPGWDHLRSFCPQIFYDCLHFIVEILLQ